MSKRAKGKSGAGGATPAPSLREAPRKLLTIKEIGPLFSVKPGQVRRWIEDGCPVEVKGGPNKSALLDFEKVKLWRGERRVTVSVAEEGAKLKQRQRERIEQEMAVRRGELLDRKTWVRVVEDHITAARSLLLALPSGLAQRLTQVAKAEGPAAVRALLEASLHEILAELVGSVPANGNA